MDRTKICAECKRTFTKPTNSSIAYWEKRTYCSQLCSSKHPWNQGKKGVQVAWNKGKTDYMSAEARKRMADVARANLAKETPEKKAERYKHLHESRARNGIWKPTALGKKGVLKVGSWKGDQATYNSKHRWIQENWNKTGTCEWCKKVTTPFGNRRFGTEWANLDGNYNRDDRNTWAELCVKCHHDYDANGAVSK